MKVKVYSRFEVPQMFRFAHYSKQKKGTGIELLPPNPDEIVVLNGINEVVNHTRLALPYATTVFTDEEDRDAKKRIYTLQDLERLKKDPTFKQMLKNGDVSIDVVDDLSKDITGIGKLTDDELATRQAKAATDDTSARLLAAKM